MDGETVPALNMPAISYDIWNMKYRLKQPDGTPIDQTVEDTWHRVAHALAAPEKQPEKWAKRFYRAMEGFKFLPAGRVIAGAGAERDVTLFNCLGGDTLVLTRELGEVPIRDLAGHTATVLDGTGNWTPAEFRCFGEQVLYRVTLTLRRREAQLLATGDHGWIVNGENVKTFALRKDDRIGLLIPPRLIADDGEYSRGVVHGIVYGDGTANADGSFSVRLCGEKSELSAYLDKSFPNWSPPSAGGDRIYRISAKRIWDDLKALPESLDESYLLGFVRGWLATDGCVSDQPEVIITMGGEDRDWLSRVGPIVGFQVIGASRLIGETNYGVRNKELWNVRFDRHFLTEEDFLRAAHRSRFIGGAGDGWRVKHVSREPACREPVFCAIVPTTNSFALAGGIHSSNCFVMGSIPDDMGGIFAHLLEAALTMQQGGGIGYDFSTLRPKGALVKGVGADASGPLSFMDVWDAMCRTIMSAGYRRGAMMATLACDHPDIEAFIDAKSDAARLRMFNLSVLVTDAFMTAVRADTEWPLQFGGKVFKTVRAAELWDRIMRSTYAYAEPGVIFIDRVNRRNNLRYCEKISATNPCGEQPLPPYGACLLGSLNLAALVTDPFTPRAALTDVCSLVRTALRMLDNVIDVSKFPLPAQVEEARNKRRIGLGVTGLADALIMCGLKYGSSEAVKQTDIWLSQIEHEAYDASCAHAAEKGVFPLFDVDEYLACPTVRRLSKSLVGRIANDGLRNSHLLSIAPTGTISLLAGNVSSGIEPIFSLLPTPRKVLMPDGTRQEFEVLDFAVAMWRKLHGDAPLPDYFIDTEGLTPYDHLAMMANAQQHVDAAISKTINVPENIPFDQFKDVYAKAYASGCKSCTTFRPNEVTGSILTAPKPKQEPPVPESNVVSLTAPLGNPEEVPARRYKVTWPDSDHALYVFLTDIEEHGRLRPWELFLTSQEAEADEWRVALGRMVSAVFRRGGDVAFVAKELKAIFDKKGGGWIGGKHMPSLPAAIGAVIERHWRITGYLPTEEKPEPARVVVGDAIIEDAGVMQEKVPAVHFRQRYRQCPKCGEAALIRVENCDRCTACDYAKC